MGGEEKDGVYESLLKDVCSPSTNRRLDAWSKIQGLQGSEDLSAERAVVLVENALPVYSDKKSKRVLINAINAWIDVEDFVKLSVVHITKRQKDACKYARSSHERHVLLSWVCSLVSKLRSTKQVKAANVMILTATQLLTAALWDAKQGRVRAWFIQKQILSKLFDSAEEDFDSMANSFLMESKEPGLLRFLAERKEIQQCASVEVRKSLLKTFVETVVTAKSKPSDIDAEAALPLIVSLTREEFESDVMPGIQRMMKRSPEVIISTLVSLLAKLKIPLDQYVMDLLQAFISQFQSSDPNQRDDAGRAAQILCKSIANASVLEETAEYLVQLIATKKAKQWFERQQVVLIMETIGKRGLELRLGAGFFNEFMKNLFEIHRKEVNDSVKESVLESIMFCASHVNAVEPQDLAILESLLKVKSDFKGAALNILVALSMKEKSRPMLLELQATVLPILKDSIAKLASRQYFPSAMLLLINLSKNDKSVWDNMEKEGITGKLQSESSSLFSQTATKKLKQEGINMAAVCRDLLLGLSDINIDTIIPDLCTQLVLLALHPDREVQKHVIDILKHINGASSEITLSLLDGLHQTLSLNECNPDFATQAMQSKAASCLIALAPLTESACSFDPVAKVIMLSHHPFFMKEKGSSFAWPLLTGHLRHDVKVDIKKLFVSFMPEMLKKLLGESGIANSNIGNVEAATHSIGVISSLHCENFMQCLLPLVLAVDDFESHSNLKESDFKIYFTPEGELADEFGTYKGEVVQSKNVRRAKGRFKSSGEAFGEPDDFDDYVPERRDTRQNDTKKKPKGKQPVDPRERMRLEQLTKESSIRAKLQVIRGNIGKILHVVNTIAIQAPDTVLDALGSLAAISTPLLSSQLLHEEALATTKALSQCLPSPLDKGAHDLANCLWLILGPEKSKDVISSRRLLDSITTISRACNSRPLYSPVYWFLFPILKCVFSSEKVTPMHEDVVKLLILHTSFEGDWPFGMTAEAIFSLWSLVPSYRADLETGLSNICQRFTKGADLLAISSGLFKSDVNIRLITCACLQKSPLWASGSIPPSNRIAIPFWIALHDVDEKVAASAENLWKFYRHGLPINFIDDMISYLNHPNMSTVESTASALSEAIEEHPGTSQDVTGTLLNCFDGLGSQGRIGIGLALKECASVIEYDIAKSIIDFILLKGLLDVEEGVRESMLNAGIAIVDTFGDKYNVELLDIFEKLMNSSAAELSLSSEGEYDMIKQGLVILLGALACHFDSSNDNVKLILEQLIGALDTPSEIVQRSVSERLPPLIKILSSNKEEMQSMISKQLEYLKEADSFGKRKGAAFGLAGMVKGLGMAALKNYDVINVLKSYIEEKKNQQAREGALLAFECLSERLGRLFEPYIIHILPLLLLAFGDGIADVRAAAQAASHVIMGKLSTQGMRLVLPALLKGLDEIAWRTKQGSVQLLGAMAYCAPKQLGACLPTIVPKIGEVLKDPHPRVQEAGKNALKEIGSVIRNPEIAQISGQLLSALADPGANTKKALESLLTTRFVNTIDAASLSLIIPILLYGLRERSKENKKKAAQIVGSLCHLVTDSKDMSPYMDDIVLSLKKVLVDPIPEVRFASAKALGSLVRGIGPGAVNELLPWLLETLKSDSTSVEKNGAAQALSEVLGVLGSDHLDQLMPEIILGCSQNTSIQEGYLTMFKYLPFAMESAFQKYLSDILPIVIAALSNDVEGVREAAFNSAKAIIEIYATSSSSLLLPVIEKGILDPMWRIRESSVELLGRLIFKLSGKTTQKSSDADDEEILSFTDQQTRHMQETIGTEQWHKILSLLYLLRSDNAYTVRTNALNIWKTIVTNTPRTLIQIVSPLMDLVIDALGEQGSDQQQTAASCLGELVRKFGERITKLILPIMEEGLQAESSSSKRGVCYGLSAILKNVSRQQIVACLPTLLPAVQSSLCDEDESVRFASGELMATLFKGAGDVIQENVLPQILQDISSDTENAELSLEGLVVMLKVRPSILMEVLPEVCTMPLTPIKARALGEIAEAIPPAGVQKQLKLFLKPIFATLNEPREEALSLEIETAAESLISCLEDDSLYDFISYIAREFDDATSCLGAAKFVQLFCKCTKLNFQEHVDQLLSSIVSVFADAEGDCLQECWNAVNVIIKSIPKERHSLHVSSLKDAVISAREHERRKRHGGDLLVAGFCKPPRALSAVLPIYLSGLLAGKNSEVREKAAEGLGELIDVTSLPSLKPSLAQITGPLIRILGDRYPWQVKLAILSSIQLLLKKAGLFLKPFVPQLQTTFLKSLHDAASEVREKASENLGQLARLTLRIDQLVKDLLNTMHTCSSEVKEACLMAVGEVVFNGPKAKLSPALVTQAGTDLKAIIAGDEDSGAVQRRAAFALGQYGARCSGQELSSLLGGICEQQSEHDMIALNSLLQHALSNLNEANLFEKCIQTIQQNCGKKDSDTKVKVAEACGIILLQEAGGESGSLPSLSLLSPCLTALLNASNNSEVLQAALDSLQKVAAVKHTLIAPILCDLLLTLSNLLGQVSGGPTKIAAEDLVGIALGITEGPEKAFANLNALKKLDPAVKQLVSLSMLKKVAARTS